MRGWGSEPPFPGLPDPVARVLPDWGGRDRPSSCTPSCPRPQLAGSGCRAAFISVPGSSTFLEPAAPFSLPKQRPLCRGHRASPLGSFLQAREPSAQHASSRAGPALPGSAASFLCPPDPSNPFPRWRRSSHCSDHHLGNVFLPSCLDFERWKWGYTSHIKRTTGVGPPS